MNKVKVGKLNWKTLFAGGPGYVQVLEVGDGRVLGTDRYAIWDLGRVCESARVEVPRAGVYQAMAKELRPNTDKPRINDARGLAAMFDELVTVPPPRFREGLGKKDGSGGRLVVSEWAHDAHGAAYRPIIHIGTADVRMIGLLWDGIDSPSSGIGKMGGYWRACAGWAKKNVAVFWGEAEQAPLGCVQLLGTGTDNLGPNMAKVMAASCGEVSQDVIAMRYGVPDETRYDRGFGLCPHCLSTRVVRCHGCGSQTAWDEATDKRWRMDHIAGVGCLAYCAECVYNGVDLGNL